MACPCNKQKSVFQISMAAASSMELLSSGLEQLFKLCRTEIVEEKDIYNNNNTKDYTFGKGLKLD